MANNFIIFIILIKINRERIKINTCHLVDVLDQSSRARTWILTPRKAGRHVRQWPPKVHVATSRFLHIVDWSIDFSLQGYSRHRGPKDRPGHRHFPVPYSYRLFTFTERAHTFSSYLVRYWPHERFSRRDQRDHKWHARPLSARGTHRNAPSPISNTNIT